ncbi:hypothetical protein [Cohnella cholangitidis]|uniref:Uncharacterized protein n=1 Tax=Cohnella cholangitidis TaxID=2598458 RepID=A0A7G5BSX6_9BACL|nr:hypothetical protein [Cohnella cholangitidis]QMV40060.1 hypothetical protein FPL14_01735 [Cohnella cholangitidis]
MKILIISIVGIVVFLLYLALDDSLKTKGKSRKSSYIIRSDKGIVSIINKLDQLGYYKYVDPKSKKEIKKNSINAGYLFGWEESGRDFTSDAENWQKVELVSSLKL